MNLAEQLRALLGLPADAADDAIFEGVKTKLATPTVDPAVQTELDATKAKLLAAENKIALSRSGQPSPEILEMQADRWTDKVDALVLAGKITPAKAAPIKAYIRTGGTPNAIALSRSGDKTAVEVLIDIAQLKDAPPTGEETGVQDPIELSRSGGAKDPMADAVEQAKQYAIKRNPK